MYQFLIRHNLAIHKKKNNLNRLLHIKEIKSIINNLSIQKAPGSDGFLGDVHLTL